MLPRQPPERKTTTKTGKGRARTVYLLFTTFLALILPGSLRAQGTITTVAGRAWVFPSSTNGGPATSAPLGTVQGVATDTAGNLFIADPGNHLVVKVSPSGVLTIVAGTGLAGFSGDTGPATSALLNYPVGVAVDSSGNLYIADSRNRRIRQVSTNGVITTVAGTGGFGFSGDGGPAASATMQGPFAVAVDAGGNLYLADTDNQRIRKINPSGVITTVAGTGAAGFSGDGGLAINAMLRSPYGVAVDTAGNLYIADMGNQRIRKVSTNGIITTVAGTGSTGYSGDGGPAADASLSVPIGVTVDASGNLWIADSGNDRIRKVAGGTITTVAGNGFCNFSGDNGPATSAGLAFPEGVVIDGAGNLFIADYYNNRVRKVDTSGTITTVAGNGLFKFGGNGGAASSANLEFPAAAAVDLAGNLYVADSHNHQIRKVSANGTITTIAGTGNIGFTGDGGAAASATLAFPEGVALDGAGNLYIGDFINGRVRKVSTAGIITTVAGGGPCCAPGDGGPATSAFLDGPAGVAVDTAGNLYIADYFNNRIRKVSAGGTITTIAGVGGIPAYGGDGGPAINANLANPWGLALEATGNLYIADSNNNRIRKVSVGGIITTVAGNGNSGFSGDGIPATSAALATPEGVTVDAAGNLYIADTQNNRIRRVFPNGTISTIAGTGSFGFSGDGDLATNAALAGPAGVALDGSGNVYFADTGSDRIRKIAGGAAPLSFSVPSSLSFTLPAGSYGYQNVPIRSLLNGLEWTASASTASGGNWLFVSPSGTTPGNLYVSVGTWLVPGVYQGTVTVLMIQASPPVKTISVTLTIQPAPAPPGPVINSVAGTDWVFSVPGGLATNAPLGPVLAVAVDSGGNVFLSDHGNGLVGKVSPTGAFSTVGGGNLFGAHGLAVDSGGNLYLSLGAQVRKVDPSGNITAVAGTGSFGFSGDGGPATSAELNNIGGVAVDGTGNLYIADTGNQRIRKVSTNGNITTVAGNGSFGFFGDGGLATSASLSAPWGVAVDAGGNLYIADHFNHRIRKVSTAGIITTVVGNGTPTGSIDGPGGNPADDLGDGGQAASASLSFPHDLAVDGTGNLFIADTANHRIRKVSTNGIISTVAGTGVLDFSGDGGSATAAALNLPEGVAVDTAGRLYIADTNNWRVRKVETTGTIVTIAGNGGFRFQGDGGPASSAVLNFPGGIAADAQGNYYIADTSNSRIRKVTPSGTITTVAGRHPPGFGGDGGPATDARLSFPQGVAVDSGGNLYVADTGNSRIRKVSTAGMITTVAGNGTFGFSGDGGPAISASLSSPWAVAVDATGNLYIADSGNNRIRKVSTAGVITTVAGGEIAGFAGDGGPAISAALNFPRGVAVDAAGNLYVADTNNHRIRKVSAAGIITTVAGGDISGFSGDGIPAITATLNFPQGVAVDVSGNLYIADSNNSRIRKVDTAGIITTVAGTGNCCSLSGDGGLAVLATLSFPGGVAVDTGGNIYIADTGSHRIRKVIPAPTGPPVVVINQAVGQPDPANTPTINFTAAFGEPVTGFTGSDVTLSGTAGATTATVSGSGAIYNVAVSGMTADGTVIATIAASVATGTGSGLGNSSSTSSDNVVFYDATPPTVTINQGAGQPDPTTVSPIHFTVVFSEPVTGFTGNDVTLSGTAGATTAIVVGFGTTYNVAVTGMVAGGTVIATIPAGGTADAAGNVNLVSTSTDNSVTFNGLETMGGTLTAPSLAVGSGSTVGIPLTLALNTGVSVETLSIGLRITPNSGAPALTGTMDFVPDAAMPAPTLKAPNGANEIAVSWLGLSPALSGTRLLGEVRVTLPNSAVIGQTYTIQITAANATFGGNTVTVTLGANTALTVAPTYLVGDAYPGTSDSAGSFGDNILNNLDLIQALRAVVNLSRPPSCSDRFDAMDAFPVDGQARGGDGQLNNLDLIRTLRRVVNLDPSRPRRATRGLDCPVQAVAPKSAPLPLRGSEGEGRSPAEGALELDALEENTLVDAGARVQMRKRQTANPIPTLSALSPSSATAGGLGFTLTVTGTNFISNSVVQWNGAARTTTFVSSTQLTASIPASDLAVGIAAMVTVFTSGGGTSNALAFTIKDPSIRWTTGGVMISTAQGRPVAVSDGAGGAIFAWGDPLNPDIVAQRLARDGSTLWPANGIMIANALNTRAEPAWQANPAIVSDGAGGAIITWEDERNLQSDIFAQRISPGGSIQWQLNGVPISTACWTTGPPCANYKRDPQIVSDGAGGAIITWYESRDGFHFSVWAQRVKADGTAVWAKDGVPVAYGSFNADFPKITSDGASGAIIAWQDFRGGPGGIFGQHLDRRGIPLWPINGIELAHAIGQRGLGGHALISDETGGAIVSWVDRRTLDANIYAQRVDATGQLLWQAGGVPICTNPMEQYSPTITNDGAHGAIIAWEDQGASPPGSGQQWILAQRVNSLGVPQWTTNGISIYTIHGFGPHITSDGRGGGIIVWDGLHPWNGPFGPGYAPDLGAQRVNGSGQIQSAANGVEVFFMPDGHYGFGPNLIGDGAGGAIVYWADDRNSAPGAINTDMFAQRINDQLITATGTLAASPAQGPPGGAAAVPVTLVLGNGVSVDGLNLSFLVTPNAGAPGLTGTLLFQKDDSAPTPTLVDTSGGPNTVTVRWSNLLSPWTGVAKLGNVLVNIPATATAGQTYTLQITALNGTIGTTPVTLAVGTNVLVAVANPTYLVGDDFPAGSDRLGDFGDEVLNNLDLIQALRAVVNLSRPPSCSDRYDAMDSAPADTDATRGGDTQLNNLDLIRTLRRVVNLDQSRPVRVSRAISPCP